LPPPVRHPLSLHDALPISLSSSLSPPRADTLRMLAQAYLHTGDDQQAVATLKRLLRLAPQDNEARQLLQATTARVQQPPAQSSSDRKSTRLNSSHVSISYA